MKGFQADTRVLTQTVAPSVATDLTLARRTRKNSQWAIVL